MSRNELCACGSGKRFKHCHGAIAPAIASGQPSALHFEALAVHRTGALRQAEALYRRALERDPSDLDSLHMLGVVRFERMRYREALDLLWEACERSGWNDPVFRHNLGLVLAKLLTPQANERQEALVAAYMERERERTAARIVETPVSVVLTVGSEARFVERALASVAAQTYRDLELVVVDAGASEETAAILARRLPALGVAARVVKSAQRGVPLAANEGTAHAQGRYLAFLEANEWFATQRLERMVAEIGRETPLWGFSRVAYAEGTPSGATEAVARPGESFGSEPASFMLMIPNVVESAGNLFIERELFRTLGGFRDVADHGFEFRERAAREVEPVVIRQRLYFRDPPADAAAHRARQQRIADGQLARALANEVAPPNPFSPLHPANREVLLRAELRAGHGDRIAPPLLRSLAAEWRGRPEVDAPRERSERVSAGAPKIALVVLGPYRSGTSALARVLNLCGAFLPQRVLAARLGINPRGFWETEAVNDLDARLMQYLGADWDRVDFALPASGPLVDEFLQGSREVLDAEYAEAPLIVIKDPRICVLAPLWHRALEASGYRPAYIVCVRNPLEVARSLGNDMPVSRGLALWLAYMRRVEDFTAAAGGHPVHVGYADLLDDWREAVRRIAHGLDVPLDLESRASDVDAFLESSLRNHRASDAELERELAGPQGSALGALYRRMLARCGR